MIVVKRDGRKVPFDKNKIVLAVEKAFVEVDQELDTFGQNKSKEIANYVEGLGEDFSVEEIQDIVENKLMNSSRKDVARAFIIYRNERSKARERNSSLMKEIQTKILATDVQNQNANVDEKSFGGRFGETAEAVLRKYALDNLVSETTKNNHINNEVYIHDLGHYALGDHNCLTMPLDDLLANGFNTRQTDVRPANSVSTAFQLVAVLFQLQSLNQFGGVSASHLDWTMVPYVRKSFYKHFRDGLKYIDNSGEVNSTRFGSDLPINAHQYIVHNGKAYKYAMDMTEREIYQAVEGMYHNLNY